MKNLFSSFFGLIILAVLFAASGALFVVDETQQVVVTRFGEPIREPIKKAGLYFKMPFIDTLNIFEKRLLEWDGDPKEIPTYEKQSIWVDSTARWRIVDPLKFMQWVGTEMIAQTRLDDVIEAATRDTVSSAYLVDSIRNSNEIIERRKQSNLDDGVDDFGQSEIKKITSGRNKLTRNILERAREKVPAFGIELVDVRIKRINYVERVKRSVFERMISERQQAAEKYRSEGQGLKAEIEGKMARELEQIQSEAYRKAQEIRGRADAKAIEIYAKAYNADPEFYSLVKTLETYKETFNENTTLMLTTDSDFYSYLNSVHNP